MTKCKVIALANQGRKVLLVDADPQGDLTTALVWTTADSLPITLETQENRLFIVSRRWTVHRLL